ncbi:acyl carrier protein [Streptomyces sp. NPDC001139]
MTLDDLIRILVRSAGEGEPLRHEGDILDISFIDLGYDSLALMETVSAIEQQYNVSIPDEDVTGQDTPRSLLELVASLRAEAA